MTNADKTIKRLRTNEALEEENAKLKTALRISTNELHDWFMKGGGKNSPFIVATNLRLLGDPP